ncbi:uncharacterized protein [Typha latifolia]|uniref:uncharacterized protein isoform X2 n=1 Tax=Typha latifolia TaxID=4733 RepID=UPI003C2AD2A9
MVQLPSMGKMRSDSELPRKAAAGPPPTAVKLEIEDQLDDEHGPFNKRSKLAFHLQEDLGTSIISSQELLYDFLDEPSPLGLRLRKSPSLVDLIQMRLSQTNSASTSEDLETGKKKDGRTSSGSGTSDKLKASNFPASLLRIGDWERISRYEGDLVAKCYFAKHKLVWEVLDGGLKSKIEIQWSDISALNATCPENGHGTLDIVLARQPLFFRETNPQPRKHTLWQATSDFTGQQASIHRRHHLQCPQGLLSKHFEKLIQCDPRLYSLSRQPDFVSENPYFESQCSVFEDQEESKCLGFHKINDGYDLQNQGLGDSESLRSGSSRCSKTEGKDCSNWALDVVGQTYSPSSVMDSQEIEENASGETKVLKDLGLPGRPSTSVGNFTNHLGHRPSGKINSGNPLAFSEYLLNKKTLKELSQYLFSDSLISLPSDEKSLMSRVNSLCCLLQKDPSTFQNLQVETSDGAASGDSMDTDISERKPVINPVVTANEANDSFEFKHTGSIARKESFGELLMHLPRIASLPQFMYNIDEDTENQRR